MPRLIRIACVVALTLLAVSIGRADTAAPSTPAKDPQWKMIDLGTPRDRAGHEMVYDSKRGVCVSYGGYWQYGSRGDFQEYKQLDNVIEFDGKRWVQRADSSAPGKRFFHSMAYDSKRGVTVLFGGGDAEQNFHGETWEWDGASWKECKTKSSPGARAQCAMCFDEKRGVVVLFGGHAGEGAFDDTWEYDGADWKQAKPAASPGKRGAHAMAYDSKRGVCVMNGGILPGKGFLDDLWEYDGKTWTERKPERPTGTIARHKLAFDSNRGMTVMFSGDISDQSMQSSLWEWDGEKWYQIDSGNPVPRSFAGLAYDSKRRVTVLFGGSNGRFSMRDTREYGGSDWASFERNGPSSITSAAIVYDTARDTVVVYSGAKTMLEIANGEQRKVTCEGDPRAMVPSMAYDSKNKRVVLFGGTNGKGGYLANTSILENSKWSVVETKTRPAGRKGHAMAYDRKRGVVVMFGGDAGEAACEADHWEFDGKDWTKIEVKDGPGPRFAHSMVYDSKRGVMVLFGGAANKELGLLNDTWEYDGKAWTRITTAAAPAARGEFAMAFDEKAGLTVLYGGYVKDEAFESNEAGDTWAYDGKAWKEIKAGGTARKNPIMAYDSTRGVLVAIGGYRNGQPDGVFEMCELSMDGK